MNYIETILLKSNMFCFRYMHWTCLFNSAWERHCLSFWNFCNQMLLHTDDFEVIQSPSFPASAEFSLFTLLIETNSPFLLKLKTIFAYEVRICIFLLYQYISITTYLCNDKFSVISINHHYSWYLKKFSEIER